MKHTSTTFLSSVVFAALLVSCKHPPARAGTTEQQHIAQACLQIMRSSLTNETDIAPDDQRLPEVVRALHPVDIEIAGQTVVVMFSLQDGLVEYHLAPVSTSPGTWQLFGAGPKFNNEHRELLRIRTQ